MAIKLGALAARLKQKVEEVQEEKEKSVDRRREELDARMTARKEAARQARSEMMDELREFANAVVHLSVEEVEEGEISVFYQGNTLTWRVYGDEDMIEMIVPDGGNHHLARNEDGKWEVGLDEESGFRHLALEEGLEEVLATFLGLGGKKKAPAIDASPAKPTKRSKTKTKGVLQADGSMVYITNPSKSRGRSGKKRPYVPGSSIQSLKGPLE